MSRVEPAKSPFPPSVQNEMDRVMRGAPPLVLFTTLARDERLFSRFMSSGLLDRGNISLRLREIVIGRVTARCGSEYEWGVHVLHYAQKAGLDFDQVRALVYGGADASCWSPEEQLALRLSDELHNYCEISNELWAALSDAFTPEALIEMILLAGFYRTVTYLTNGLRLPLEPGAPRFSDYQAA